MPDAVRGQAPRCAACSQRRGPADLLCWTGGRRACFLPLLEIPLFISSAFAQSAPAAGGGDMMSSLGSMLPLLLMFVVLYFVMIRPQMKRQKEARAMIEALAKGDEVATSGGVLGKITQLGEQYLTIEIAKGVEVQIQRTAVVQVLPKGAIK
jgi:preprotein translocase subunit YajC